MRILLYVRLALSPRRQRLLAAVQRGARRRTMEVVSHMLVRYGTMLEAVIIEQDRLRRSIERLEQGVMTRGLS